LMASLVVIAMGKREWDPLANWKTPTAGGWLVPLGGGPQGLPFVYSVLWGKLGEQFDVPSNRKFSIRGGRITRGL